MIFAVLDVSLIMGLNIGETDNVFCINLILVAGMSLHSIECPQSSLCANTWALLKFMLH